MGLRIGGLAQLPHFDGTRSDVTTVQEIVQTIKAGYSRADGLCSWRIRVKVLASGGLGQVM
jgi:hypothetical protein